MATLAPLIHGPVGSRSAPVRTLGPLVREQSPPYSPGFRGLLTPFSGSEPFGKTRRIPGVSAVRAMTDMMSVVGTDAPSYPRASIRTSGAEALRKPSNHPPFARQLYTEISSSIHRTQTRRRILDCRLGQFQITSFHLQALARLGIPDAHRFVVRVAVGHETIGRICHSVDPGFVSAKDSHLRPGVSVPHADPIVSRTGCNPASIRTEADTRSFPQKLVRQGRFSPRSGVPYS